MELISKTKEEIAFNTRPKVEEHMINKMDKSTHQEFLSQSLQTNNKQFKIAVTLPSYQSILNVIKNYIFYFTVSINDDDFTQTIIAPFAYEVESVNCEI